jgi:CheY-like chemotaxis protein
MNLCVNAVDAMPERGTLTVRTRNLDPGWIEVLVADTGTGMTREILDKALEPFFTTKEVGKGTGLGLSMVYSTVKAHRGRLELQSEPGRGTRVRMRFPACAAGTRAAVPGPKPPLAPSSRALTVLLVDDDELIQSSMRSTLEFLGHSAATASDGESALAMLEAGLEPDVVILDMNMPGLGGCGTLPRLRALCPGLPVLLATGRADQTAQNLTVAYPKVSLMSKPFTLRELQRGLEGLLAGAGCGWQRQGSGAA